MHPASTGALHTSGIAHYLKQISDAKTGQPPGLQTDIDSDPCIQKMNIYTNRDSIKIWVALLAVVISGISLWYTDALVKTLAERERKLIDLFAKAYKVIGSADSNENQTFLFQEVIENNKSIPVILTDEKENIIYTRNLALPEDLSEARRNQIIAQELAEMKEQYAPIEIEVPGVRQFIFYRNSDLITQLKYYPFIQLGVIGIFGIFAYLAFSYSRKAEQNRVWVGLAKETAHQLGTPLSSLMAWVEYFKADDRFAEEDFVGEIEKDIEKLETITARFSNMGSVPVLKEENVVGVVNKLVDYLRKRISTKVSIDVRSEDLVMLGSLNRSLFEWVLENIMKNAVDAMAGTGALHLEIGRRADTKIFIDITDTGKGMTKSIQSRVFDPGFTTKKRGWGLGLTLSKRIMENYHKGRLYVKRSEPGVGTTFRIVI